MGLSHLKGWSTPWTLRHWPESLAKGVVTEGIRTLARISPDSWSTTRYLGHRPEWPVTAGETHMPSDMGLSHPRHLVDTKGLWTQATVAQDRWSTPRAVGCNREWPGTAGPTHRPSKPSQSRPGHLVDPRGLGHGPESPLRPVRHCGPLELDTSRKRRRVYIAIRGTRARVT